MCSNPAQAMVYFGALAAFEDRAYLEPRMDPGYVDVINTTITGHRVGNHEVFRTDYWFFLGAALVELVCICLVAPTYW